jgi:hypothetical protein
MAKEEKVKKALGGSKGEKLHSHSVKYHRADNGGLHAEVERHTKAGHHHTEHHVLASTDDAAEHLQEHMGDQPPIGDGSPPDSVEPPGGADAGAGMAAGGAAPPDAGAMMGGGM